MTITSSLPEASGSKYVKRLKKQLPMKGLASLRLVDLNSVKTAVESNASCLASLRLVDLNTFGSFVLLNIKLSSLPEASGSK